MHTRTGSLPIACVIASVALLQPAHGALLEGFTVAVVSFHGTAPDSTHVIGPVAAIVGTGAEFVDFGWDSFVDVDVSDARIVITLNVNQPFGYSEVLRVMDPDGRLPNFASVIVNPVTTYAGFTQSRLLVTPNAIDIYLTGLDGLQGQQITLDVTAVPVPLLPTSVNDTFGASFNTALVVPAPGVLANDNPNGGGPMTAVRTGGPNNGALTLNPDGGFTYAPTAGFFGSDSFTYQAVNATGAGNVATVTIMVASATVPLPPVGLYASSVVGNLVTLRWSVVAGGLVPTNFVLEGGLSPGEVLESVPTGSPSPIFTFPAPTGSFYVRVRAMSGSVPSAASNEIRIHVNVPVPPSPPTGLLALVNGCRSVALAWRNTFNGGAPTNVVLDVTSPSAVLLPLGNGDKVSYNGIPPGTYTFSLRAANAAGASGASNTITLTVPASCSGAPGTPTNFLAYRIGSTVSVLWDPAATGPAPTDYVLDVTGSLITTIPTTDRGLSSAAPPGSYTVSVRATNPCGSSEPTAAQTVVVP